MKIAKMYMIGVSQKGKVIDNKLFIMTSKSPKRAYWKALFFLYRYPNGKVWFADSLSSFKELCKKLQ